MKKFLPFILVLAVCMGLIAVALSIKNSNNTSGHDNTENLSCSVSVRCDNILENMNSFNPDKIDIVPPDGVIYEETNVIFSPGENIFDILQRELKQNKIHFEFSKTSVYDTAYIEGIANIYAADCGELSGWLYTVNDKYPDCGLSQYTVKSGDEIKITYSCDFSKDVPMGSD